MRRRIGAWLLLAGIGALALWWAVSVVWGGRVIPDDPLAIAAGRAVYETHCASCHGATLEGEPNWRVRRDNGRLPAPPHDASGHTWHHADAVLFAITKNGLAGIVSPGYQTDMPAFAEILTDGEIENVLAYIKSTWPPEIRARQREINRRSPR